MNKQLGEQLKKIRIETFKDLGLRRVADKANVNYSYLYRVEEGVHVPSDEFLTKLLSIYNVSLKQKLDIFMLAHSEELKNMLTEVATGDPQMLQKVFYRKNKKK